MSLNQTTKLNLKNIRIRELMIWIILILMTTLSAFRDLIIFGAHRTWIPLWDTSFNLDAMHASGGLFTLLIALLIVVVSQPKYRTRLVMFRTNWIWFNIASHICIYWFAFYWLRNIFYHILLRKPEFMEWIYLLPFGGLL